MQALPHNWYIQYDEKTLTLLNSQNYRAQISKQVQQFLIKFNNDQHQTKDRSYNIQSEEIPDWLTEIAEATMQILEVLYNFYNVEFKLSKVAEVKAVFRTLCQILKIQFEYTKFYFIRSVQFRLSRILASSLRLNGFMRDFVIEKKKSENLKKLMDQTFLDNLDEVYLFMKQRCMQTLEITKCLGPHDINIILMDRISALMRLQNDPTMHGVLDINKQKQIVNKILQGNYTQSEFMRQKIAAQKHFQENRYFQIVNPVQEDPNIKKNEDENENENQQNSFAEIE